MEFTLLFGLLVLLLNAWCAAIGWHEYRIHRRKRDLFQSFASHWCNILVVGMLLIILSDLF